MGPVQWLSFTESLDPATFSVAAKESTLAFLTEHLRRALPEGVIVAANGLQVFASRAELIVSVSKKGKILMPKRCRNYIPRHIFRASSSAASKTHLMKFDHAARINGEHRSSSPL